MNNKEFYRNYNLKDTNIIDISNIGEDLSIILELEMDISYIGNGLRTSFEEHYYHQFIFKRNKSETTNKPYNIHEYCLIDDEIHLKINNTSLIIKDNGIVIHSNYHLG